MYFDYMLYDPTEDEECKDCKLLPICMGGCPYQRVINKKRACNRFKGNMNDFMKKIVEIRLKQVVGEQHSLNINLPKWRKIQGGKNYEGTYGWKKSWSRNKYK